MDLIERYLAAVGRHLPAKASGDILGELREELLSRQEEREASLGRPLTRQDIEALLLEFGHPLVVAARYRKTQHLIGPEVFPFWLTTIQWSLGILAIVYVTLLAVAVLLGRTNADIRGVGSNIVSMAIGLFGVITLAFAAFERFGKAGFLRDWKPSRLPPPGRGSRTRATLVGEMVADVIFVLWWQGAIHFQALFPYPVHLSVALGPVWAAWHWPILVYALWEIGADVIALARPQWTRTNTAMLAGRYFYGVAILGQVFQAGHWVEVNSPILQPNVLAIIQTNFDLGMKVGIGIAILGMLLRVGLEFWRIYRRQGLAAAV
ncbi:MAG: hypothetical protein JSR98_11450 [Proteobacteria bacterium]|nr:hypothetical protein [Pseudomonadota bacterium]